MKGGRQHTPGVGIGLVALAFLVWATHAAAQDEDFRFVAPERGAAVESGESVRVEIAGRGLAEVMLVAPGFSETRREDGSGTFVFDYGVPPTASGAIELTAFGRGRDDTFVNAATTVNVTFKPERIEIRSLRVEPERVELRVGQKRALTVTATLPDLSELDVTETRFGTSYEPAAADSVGNEVAVVDDEGRVEARTRGEIDVIVRHPKADQPLSVRVVVSGPEPAEQEE